MKKILAAVAVVFAAVGLQAAVVAWGTDAIMTPGEGGAFTGTKTAKGSVTGFLWEVDATTYAIYAAALDTVYTEFQKDGYGALGAITADATSGTTRKVNLTGTTQYAEGDTAYAIVLYTYNDGEKDWYIANAAKYEGIGTSDAAVAQLNGFVGGSIEGVAQGSAITGWSEASAVPEPTTGLLLLLGVAGLALRRKQK
jgi:hypothetical protein